MSISDPVRKRPFLVVAARRQLGENGGIGVVGRGQSGKPGLDGLLDKGMQQYLPNRIAGLGNCLIHFDTGSITDDIAAPEGTDFVLTGIG